MKTGIATLSFPLQGVVFGGSSTLTNVFLHSNCSALDDFVLNGLSTNVWHTGTNVLAVKVFDEGDTSYFDSRISIISSSPP